MALCSPAKLRDQGQAAFSHVGDRGFVCHAEPFARHVRKRDFRQITRVASNAQRMQCSTIDEISHLKCGGVDYLPNR